MVGVFICTHIIKHPVLGKCDAGSEKLSVWGRTSLWCPELIGVEEWSGWKSRVGGRAEGVEEGRG